MKIRSLFSPLLLWTFCATALAQSGSAPGYHGWWSQGQPLQMIITAESITLESGRGPAEVLKYLDITPPGNKQSWLQVTTPTDADSPFKFLSAAMPKKADGAMLKLRYFQSLEDLKSDKNELLTDVWNRDTDPHAPVAETFTGTLQKGETDSVILYFGEESGDYAGFCFKNDSSVGRTILATVKKDQKCSFTGTIDYEKGCKVPGLEADLSAAGRIISIQTIKVIP